MRISDWSSDVCSSDLIGGSRCGLPFVLDLFDGTLDVRRGDGVVGSENNRVTFAAEKLQPAASIPVGVESGRCRMRHGADVGGPIELDHVLAGIERDASRPVAAGPPARGSAYQPQRSGVEGAPGAGGV